VVVVVLVVVDVVFVVDDVVVTEDDLPQPESWSMIEKNNIIAKITDIIFFACFISDLSSEWLFDC
jgi:hypothetical protein